MNMKTNKIVEQIKATNLDPVKDLGFKGARIKIFEAIRLNKDIEEVCKDSDIALVTFYWNLREMGRAFSGEQKPQKTEIKSQPEPQPQAKPQTRDSFVPIDIKYYERKVAGNTDVKLLQTAYENRQNILIIGDTGSGKTHLVRHIACINKVPYMRVNLNGATTPEDLLGQFIPNNDVNATTKYVFKDGVLVDFMRHGGIFVVDEINMCPADILSILNSVTDDERKLVLTPKDGEVISAHPDFWIVATMNPDYEGTKPLNIALKDRFRTVVLSYNINVEKKMCQDEKFLEVVEKLRKSDMITTPVSTRDIIKYVEDCKIYGVETAQYFFINNFEALEQPVVSEIIELVINGTPIQNEEKKEESV